MGGQFDVARARLVGTSPASEEQNQTRCGLVDAVSDRSLALLPPNASLRRCRAGCVKLSRSDSYLLTRFTFLERKSKGTQMGQISHISPPASDAPTEKGATFNQRRRIAEPRRELNRSVT